MALPARAPTIIRRSSVNTPPPTCKKNARKGRFRVLVEVVGVVPLAETPRQTIVNRLFCLTRLQLSKLCKAKCSLPFAAPTLNSDHDDLYQQTKNTPRGGIFVCGGGGRSRNQHESPTIKTHQFRRFLPIFGRFCIVFHMFSNRI